jgi:arylsulfatase A-like enzyme
MPLDMTKPNLLFICCDDLNDAIAGLGGHPQAHTPNLDRLCQRGVRFTNGQVNVPICGPSRASFLSGLAPWTTGYYGYNFGHDPWWNNALLGAQPTFMEHAGANGYGVYGTGKIFHNGQEKQSVWNREHGHMVDWGPWTWDGKTGKNAWAGSAGHQDMPFHSNNPDTMIASLDRVPEFPADPKTGAHGHRGWRNWDGSPFRYASRDDRDPMNDELNGEWAAEVLSRPHEDEPFMLCLGIGRPHSPLIAPQEYFDMFPLDEIELSPQILAGDVDDCAQIMRDGDTTTTSWGFKKFKLFYDNGGEESLRKWTQAYLACIAFADACIGKALDALWSGPHADNTYVVFTSDNGYHMGEKDFLFKNSLWERSARVPLLVAGPGCAQGAECDQPVSLLDLYPSINEWLGLPDDVGAHELEGHSLADLARNPVSGNWDGPPMAVTAIGCSTPVDAGEPAPAEEQHFSVRSRTHRYLRYANGEEELYDHRDDRYEWRNIAADAGASAIKEEMQAQLRMQVTALKDIREL